MINKKINAQVTLNDLLAAHSSSDARAYAHEDALRERYDTLRRERASAAQCYEVLEIPPPFLSAACVAGALIYAPRKSRRHVARRRAALTE